MKKMIFAIMLMTTAVMAQADIYCTNMGDGVMYCEDSQGNNWIVYTGGK